MKIKDDLKSYSKGSILKGSATLFFNPNFHATLLYRFANTISKVPILIPFCKILMYINRVVYSVDIDYRAELSGGLKLIHGIGIIIGKEVKSDGPLTIYQGVTIGGNENKQNVFNGKVFHQPWFDENVIIYSGATIIGPCKIGKNVSIGANTLINKDITQNKIVFNKNEIIEKKKRGNSIGK